MTIALNVCAKYSDFKNIPNWVSIICNNTCNKKNCYVMPFLVFIQLKCTYKYIFILQYSPAILPDLIDDFGCFLARLPFSGEFSIDNCLSVSTLPSPHARFAGVGIVSRSLLIIRLASFVIVMDGYISRRNIFVYGLKYINRYFIPGQMVYKPLLHKIFDIPEKMSLKNVYLYN